MAAVFGTLYFVHFMLNILLFLFFLDNIDSQEEYQFGHVSLESSCVFARTSLSFAFVNIKPVLPGRILYESTVHSLVCSKM